MGLGWSPLCSVLGSGWLLADRGAMLEGVPGPLTERGSQVARELGGSGGDSEKLMSPSNGLPLMSLLLSHSSCSARVCCLFLSGSPADDKDVWTPEDAPHCPAVRTVHDPVGSNTAPPPPAPCDIHLWVSQPKSPASHPGPNSNPRLCTSDLSSPCLGT